MPSLGEMFHLTPRAAPAVEDFRHVDADINLYSESGTHETASLVFRNHVDINYWRCTDHTVLKKSRRNVGIRSWRRIDVDDDFQEAEHNEKHTRAGRWRGH